MREPAELGTPSTQNRSLTATGGSAPGVGGGLLGDPEVRAQVVARRPTAPELEDLGAGDLAGGDQLAPAARR